jgi:lipopolysaccharide/colanic/teichoic acid biosynthesis glycosyltransferase
MAFDRRETAILLIGDFLILIGSLWTALLLRNLRIPSAGYFEANLIPFLPMFLISIVVFYIAGLYEKQTRPIRSVMGIRILGAQAATVTIAAVLFFILPFSIAPKTILALYLLVSVAAASVWRFQRMTREIKRGNRSQAILIGAGPAVQELYEEVNGNNLYMLRFGAHLNPASGSGTLATMLSPYLEGGVTVVVVDTSDSVVRQNLPELYKLMQGDLTFIEFASLYEEIFDRIPIDHLDTVQIRESFPVSRTVYDAAKRIFDVALTLVLSIVAVPIVACAAAILSLTGGSPFIFPERIGRGGRSIKLWKLRTMLFYDAGDPVKQKQNRVTGFGRFLRKTRIDELPQLINVLKGELSFIGPRPELPKIAEVYEREIPQYRMRHLITPGLSGWAQILHHDPPKGAADVAKTRRKLSYDLYYLKHRSFGLDLAIAIKTLRTLLAFSGT